MSSLIKNKAKLHHIAKHELHGSVILTYFYKSKSRKSKENQIFQFIYPTVWFGFKPANYFLLQYRGKCPQYVPVGSLQHALKKAYCEQSLSKRHGAATNIGFPETCLALITSNINTIEIIRLAVKNGDLPILKNRIVPVFSKVYCGYKLIRNRYLLTVPIQIVCVCVFCKSPLVKN